LRTALSETKGKKLPLHAVWLPRSASFSFTLRWKPEITHFMSFSTDSVYRSPIIRISKASAHCHGAYIICGRVDVWNCNGSLWNRVRLCTTVHNALDRLCSCCYSAGVRFMASVV
jgi:hypothetical protein